jgi:hypothetical protein
MAGVFGRATSVAGSAGGVASGAAAVGQSSLTSGAYMAMMQAQNQEAIRNSLATAQMSKELSEAQALGKFIKACGDGVKSLAP